MEAVKDTVNQATNYVSGKTGQATHAAKQEGHEQGAKDSSAPVTERLADAGNYLKEGANKKSDEAQAAANKPGN